MLDHVFLPVRDLDKSLAFYIAVLAPLGIRDRLDYDGKDGPRGHPDLKGIGAGGRMFFWLRQAEHPGSGLQLGFVATSRAEVDAAWAAAMAAGATDDGAPDARLHYAPRYYAANVIDPDGHCIEFVYKSWQHPERGG